ncbi:MAG: undecaprenyl-diphosphatase UppP [Patescibacteria group bacterium]|nr:undecaprenyl-diphosphatase UppP [Patescibacteria group bacterium]
MDIFQAIILGIFQGLTEFLPISSSAHLVLIPHFFGWDDPGLTFDVALHFGTLIAVLFYFRNDIVEIIFGVACCEKDDCKGKERRYPENMIWLIALATIPGAVAGYFFSDLAESSFRHPLLIASTLAFFGFFLFWADKFAKKQRKVDEIGFVDALTIGFSQAIAIVPGVSRSGITITVGLLQGLDRKNAARFSFLMSVPIILGANLFKVKHFFATTVGFAEIVGIAAAMVSGYFAIAGLIKFIEKASYNIFFWYRLALAFFIFVMWFWF